MTQPVYFANTETEYAAGARLRLNTAEWTILSHINEHVAPVEPEDATNFDTRPYACARFLGMRERAQQARQHIPLEVAAFQQFSRQNVTCTPSLLDNKQEQQEDADRVPGGYIRTIVWNIVPGIRLEDACSNKVFWSLARKERDLIRDAFQRTLP
ncbi:uncharacterized protein BO66DRAFT_438400 [Aspergillus aculeatinus CBS 121060]|uniref:Uncharacterized protein n=1 Tax=Aspergillus aculeatinus CBS 121060 TaxID=1448322 RepID=A0ACD1H9G8_9EURO|nr:hypothetical protein BO66DRAFT_438400 [Aspergillus aculeatinus CBS 121060]RAH70400.1 hypothetical protein BO66DRAFT_438400 [Aspergillus aculeatinus CBS 121060]